MWAALDRRVRAFAAVPVLVLGMLLMYAADGVIAVGVWLADLEDE